MEKKQNLVQVFTSDEKIRERGQTTERKTKIGGFL